MKKMIVIDFKEFQLLRYCLEHGIFELTKGKNTCLDFDTLQKLDVYDSLLSKLSNAFNSKRKPDFD